MGPWNLFAVFSSIIFNMLIQAMALSIIEALVLLTFSVHEPLLRYLYTHIAFGI